MHFLHDLHSLCHGWMALCLSVYLCVCLSQVGVLLKRLNEEWHKQCPMISNIIVGNEVVAMEIS